MPKTKLKLDGLPKGEAGEEITEGCLVLEGGAFRGLYTQGLLDAFMQNGLNFSCVIGVSAGALSGMNYVSGQIGRSARINLGFRHDSRYVGMKAFFHSGSILDVGFLTEDRGILEPFDIAAFQRRKQRFIAVATNCRTGRPTCFEKGRCSDIFRAVRASATMPYISPKVWINDTPFLDGGCSCKIPYKWAIKQGFKKIIVIRTRDAEFRKPAGISRIALSYYRRYREFAIRLARSNMDYNRQCDEIEALHENGRLFRISPSQEVTVSRVEGDIEKLKDLYWLGYNDGIENIGMIREYLAKNSVK